MHPASGTKFPGMYVWLNSKGCLRIQSLTEMVISVTGGPDPRLEILPAPQEMQLELFATNKQTRKE